MTEYEITCKLSNMLESRLGDGFSVRMEYDYFGKEGIGKFRPDLVVLFRNEPLALVEVKNGPVPDSNIQLIINQYGRILYDFRIRFFILYDGKEYFLLDRANSDSLTRSSFSRIITVLKGKDYSDYPLPSIKKIIQKVTSFIPDSLPNYERMILFINSLNEQDLKKDWDDIGKVVFANDQLEKRFISLLLNTNHIEQVCRYTTLSSTFRLLEGPKQNMCSIVCMNDRSENYYADSRVKYPITGTAQCNENNDTFIISCVDMKMFDNLTMWRLYGDDTKGSNLVYRVNNEEMPDFYLGRVSYEQEDGTHPELEFIERLFNQKLSRGFRFKLRHWNIWKHFFKSHHFSIEKEVRLLYFNTNSADGNVKEIRWIENSENKIVSKMALFPIDNTSSFPLVLKEIRLGPNVPEKDALIDQYDYMARQRLTYSVDVNPSTIQVYRK